MRTLLVATLFAVSLAAAADGVRLPPNANYRSECGSCHVPYPPQLLPAVSWRELMARLDRHFGSDASLDAKMNEEISRYLAANAGRRDPPSGAEPRITETRWFRKEHREVPAARWRDPAVKSPANCGACHALAEQGNYDD
jgi:hypothetical protein